MPFVHMNQIIKESFIFKGESMEHNIARIVTTPYFPQHWVQDNPSSIAAFQIPHYPYEAIC